MTNVRHENTILPSDIITSKNEYNASNTENWKTVLLAERTYKILEKLKQELSNNQLLLTEKMLATVKEKLNQTDGIKISKDSDTRFSVIKADDGTLYALSHGKTADNQSLVVGRGKLGIVKYAQNLSTGEICLVKIQKYNENECEFLRRQKLFMATATRNVSSSQEKQYIFMKIAPGITQMRLTKILEEKRIKLTQGEQVCILLSAFNEIKKIIDSGIWNMDIHDRNMMIDPVTLKVTLIDFGIAQDSRIHEEAREVVCDQYCDATNIIRTMLEFIKDPELIDFLFKVKKSLEKEWMVNETLYNLDSAITDLLFPIISQCMKEENIANIFSIKGDPIKNMFSLFFHHELTNDLNNQTTHKHLIDFVENTPALVSQ